MEPRILNIGSEGPQSDILSQSFSRATYSDFRKIHTHSPWSVRWEEVSPSEINNDFVRIPFPGTGDLLHACYLVITINEGVSVVPPVASSVIREVVFRSDGDIIDKVDGEWIALSHDMERTYDENIGRDILDLNVVEDPVTGKYTFDTTKSIIVDLPFWFRGGISRGMPICGLEHGRHEIHIKTRLRCATGSDVPGTKNGIVDVKMIYEISDVSTRDRHYLIGRDPRLLGRLGNTLPGGWKLSVTTRNRMIIPLEGRQTHSVILPYTNELVGVVFALRPIEQLRQGRFVRFDGRITDTRTEDDLDEQSVEPLYRDDTGELLEYAEITIGSHILERREALWWRNESWRLSGRQPPDRYPFVYGRFWDIDQYIPSGGTYLEHLPRTELKVKLNCDSPDCELIIWGIQRNEASIVDRKVILHHII